MKSFIFSLCLISALFLRSITAQPLDKSLEELNHNIGQEIENAALDTPSYQADEIQNVRQNSNERGYKN